MIDCKFVKKGFIFSRDCASRSSWWQSHVMAPSAVYIDGVIRVYFGGWDQDGISRISYIDLDPINPKNVLHIQETFPILDVGRDGMFDENGVFPAHATVVGNEVLLYYTGFQLGYKIPHYNFGGLAKSNDGKIFKRVSESPVLDRADEGLCVRAGQSILFENDIYKTVYSIGSGFTYVGGKDRPTYDIAYQESNNGIDYLKKGERILCCDESFEHGLGRPQLLRIRGIYYVFYTRRMVNMKYFIGAAVSVDGYSWQKTESIFSGLNHSDMGFDSEMIYFPSVVYVPVTDKYLLFYCGNQFGKTGFGYAELFE